MKKDLDFSGIVNKKCITTAKIDLEYLDTRFFQNGLRKKTFEKAVKYEFSLRLYIAQKVIYQYNRSINTFLYTRLEEGGSRTWSHP